MEVFIDEGKIKWGSTMEKETRCEYYKDRGCKCTSQTSCKNCRFIHPSIGFEKQMLREMTKIQDLQINELINELQINKKNFEDQILAIKFFESTHCSEF